MIIRQVCEIKNHQLIIRLPEDFKNKTRVWVTLDDSIENYGDKIALIQKASSDPLFTADINEINEDFRISDAEIL
jgi:hypothetical protein